MKRVFFVVLLFVIYGVTNINADQKAPYISGEIWWVSQGNNQGGHSVDPLKFGWDFNFGSGDQDLGLPVIAAATGTTVAISNDDSYNGGWGNEVIIQRLDGGYDRYGHLNTVVVKKGEYVPQGRVVGFMGTTGYSTGVHLHFQHQNTLDGNSVPSTFSDIGSADGCNCTQNQGWNSYLSGNDNIFVLEENARGLAGKRYGDVHWWPGDWNANDRYENTYARRCYLQDYKVCNESDIIVDTRQASTVSASEIPSSDNCQYHAIVYDALGGARKVYAVKGDFWSTWSSQGGPQGPLGMPITNQYYYGGTIRQDFQKGYMENGVPQVGYEGGFAPGVTGSGWDNQFSYLFALAYERNGGRTKVGYATGPIEDYGPAEFKYKRQNFTGGEYGDCCIMYDLNNAVGNEQATNEAYLLRSGFYDYYEANGGSILGCPTRDEYSSRDPQHWEDSREYPLQNFFDRAAYNRGEASQHYMIWGTDDGKIYYSAYTVSYGSQSPAGQVNLFPGQTY